MQHNKNVMTFKSHPNANIYQPRPCFYGKFAGVRLLNLQPGVYPVLINTQAWESEELEYCKELKPQSAIPKHCVYKEKRRKSVSSRSHKLKHTKQSFEKDKSC